MVERMKKALGLLYTDRMNLFEKRVIEGEFTAFERVEKYKNVPCRMSAKNYLFGDKGASEKNNQLAIVKRVKIFFPVEYEILPGSEIEIIRGGRRSLFGKSGEMHSYGTYNTVMVEIVKDYA